MTTEARRDQDGQMFEDRYALARSGVPGSVPWAHHAPQPMLVEWLDGQPRPPAGRNRALVIGCGLGDDAEALATAGWDVTAFDISEAAVAWARERFPDTTVHYEVASVFTMPSTWHERFDLVVEIFTIQSLPLTRRQAIVERIASTVAEGGTLLLVSFTREPGEPRRGRPWPLTAAEVSSFTRYGLLETGRWPDQTPNRPPRILATFTRLAARPRCQPDAKGTHS